MGGELYGDTINIEGEKQALTRIWTQASACLITELWPLVLMIL